MGFVVGDAMGVPLERKSREELLKKPVTKMTEFGSHNMPAGTWSDDTSMMIATIDSINSKNGIDYEDIALKFVAYKDHAQYTPDHEVFGMGGTTIKSLDRFAETHDDPTTNGLTEIESNGNGSLMRILPIAYYAVETHLKDMEVLQLVKNISSITHAHELSVLGCYIYTRFAMFLLNGKDKYSAYSMTKCVDYTMFSEEAQKYYERLLKDDISKLKIKDIHSSSFVVDSLEACIWVLLKSESYKEAIIGAINLGGDTDTIAALTGGLAGIINGYDFIPKEWVDKIARKEYLLDIFEEFSENKYE
jgi:ADP-ribosylglycohydrolase